ncbi:hypothetical protein DY000_02040437 [Brassica cretica]|uniref:Uncharacterized protein n=1 Tax=Brassica cretica TaxID=69181 RepID=A0ABQ7BJC2_BRACR|nr:hypothetical protein DY000_02040437 [Brassica cretica]
MFEMDLRRKKNNQHARSKRKQHGGGVGGSNNNNNGESEVETDQTETVNEKRKISESLVSRQVITKIQNKN